MGKRAAIKTKATEIVSYWTKHQDECGLSVDWAEAEERCWRCGCKRNLERCHIIPDSLGGKDMPENLVLLCKRCHAEGPNVTDPEIMWDWIRAYGVPFYDTFWIYDGMREYKFIYKHNFAEALKYITDHSEIEKNIDEVMNFVKKEIKKVSERSSTHYGQNYWNTVTYAGNYRMIIKEFAKEMGVDMKEMDKELAKDPKPWWVENII